uniref:NADH dehydrogenase subunit 3 n=1 Tax=Augomonoctenus smithi TaxID=1519147 RepID=UPI0023F21486|nr:NADH dehydrogenase subunit 3 [Augomonoctenus smithi]WDY84673.1 NADH dehydrogenase subunit 3 [Augomonoctenus smithi]
MKIMFFMMIINFLLSILFLILMLIFSKKNFNDREKNTPFECGFDPKGPLRMNFSIRFFLIAVIFLIFDVEIMLMMPMMMMLSLSNLIILMYMMMYFIIILLIGLYYEWMFGALNWI